MKKLLHSARAVLVAYFTAELIRSKGLAYGFLSLAVWLSMFIVPASLFAKGEIMHSALTGILVGISVFLAYNTATWDWALLLRWLIQLEVLEYVMASGSSIVSHYLGTIPVSIAWYSIALGVAYTIVSVFLGPPNITVVDPLALVAGICSLMLVLLAYSFILGGTVLSVGSAGPILEFIAWILPVATGSITPLAFMPKPIQIFAYLTPFSYPAELLRYSLGVSSTLLDPGLTAIIGASYSAVFFTAGLLYLNHQVRKLLREGIRSVALF
ncbi:MAG: ABC transporter permease [Sulfolobales archaeon]|nr:ABC transporter permease [Sulfolobales archaeon]MDW8082281.1 ABC transporter permease [Sulfolobales archaeon]